MNPQDVVMEYYYGHSKHLLEKNDFGPDYVNAYVEIPKASGLLKHVLLDLSNLCKASLNGRQPSFRPVLVRFRKYDRYGAS